MNKGSNDPSAPRGVAEIRFNKEGELIAADGYGNKRVSVWDPKTLKIKRYWGAYGTKRSTTQIRRQSGHGVRQGSGQAIPQPGALRRSFE